MIRALALCLLASAAAQEAPREIDGRRLGYLYMELASRALQDDDFLNPAFFLVERGQERWSTVQGSAGKSCAACHGAAEASMRGVAARYPVVDADRGGLVNLEGAISDSLTRHMGARALEYESEELLALTAYIALQSRGLPMTVAVDGEAQPYWEQGRAIYTTKTGQLNLACTDCHDRLAGENLRGDVLSQGQVNAFPLYRLLWDAPGSRHRMFDWCMASLRAEPYAAGSPEFLALELYVAWRGRGLAIEAPGVRR